MNPNIYQVSPYDYRYKELAFNTLCDAVGNAQLPGEALLIGNVELYGLRLDALLFCGGGIRIFCFMEESGRVVVDESEPWQCDEMYVRGSAGWHSPYLQLCGSCRKLHAGLRKTMDADLPPVSGAVVFSGSCTFNKSWLPTVSGQSILMADATHANDALTGLATPVVSNVQLRQVALRLNIESYRIDLQHPEEQVQQDQKTAAMMFADLIACVEDHDDLETCYNTLSRVFQQCLDMKTGATQINFSGNFAKTDYLLKEKQANGQLAIHVNETRARLRQRHLLTHEQRQHYQMHDLRNICHFIALVYGAEIPAALSVHFPAVEHVEPARRLVGECVRVVVERWGDRYLYARDEKTDTMLKICYLDENPKAYNHGDWSYLRDLFYRDAQLNLVRPRQEQGVVYPELIIFEPDYLVDVSAVARCFTNYGETPFTHLIHRIEPSVASEPIVLGNFAGQLLDEVIHRHGSLPEYRESVMAFFRNNAIALLTTPTGNKFHAEAMNQGKNIRQALGTTLHQLLQRFDVDDGIVEPSFFSEMLGLQGRMDYLQLDFRVLIEQKSGKGEYPYDFDGKPHHREEHYVQLLLYMAMIRYNYREIYEANGRELHAFLLYSKYKESLDALSWAPDLLFRALKLRNRMAWVDILCAQPGGYQIMGMITPESLNKKRTASVLWNKWQLPRLQQLLQPIGQASPLEQAYYYRFLNFIANEHLMSKLGNKTKENSGFAAKWHDALEDKRQAGNIYDRLTLEMPDNVDGEGVTTLVLRFSETPDNDMANFRMGDIVILYPYADGEEPDVRQTMVYRCTIADIETQQITLKLRFAQTDNRVFLREKNKWWAIEHDFMEASYGALYRGMHAFLSAPQERRDLLLLQRTPRVDGSKRLVGDYGEFNTLMTRVKQAEELFLIIGPPGTGKTSYGMLNTVKETLCSSRDNVLVMSYTNRAVDEICSKLQEEGIGFVRLGGENSCGEQYRSQLLSQKVAGCGSVEQLRHEVIDGSRVFVATTTSMNAHLSLLQIKHFSLALIDEASQILEPHIVGILCATCNGRPAVEKVVMIGDQKQLPAVVQQRPEVSMVYEQDLQEICLTDCRLSLFERLLRKYGDRPEVTYMLTKQGRMHPDIALFPNVAFYHGRLQPVPLPHQETTLSRVGMGRNGIEDLLLTRRVAFLAVDAPKASPSDKVNQAEADRIAAVVVAVYRLEQSAFDVNRTVGVIVPYRNQIATVRKAIDRYGIACLHDITIDTVERYQGSQRRYIVYGFTVQKFYQLDFLTNNVYVEPDGTIIDRKLNVAMTRAQEHLLMVGNPRLLANDVVFSRLIDYVKALHGYFDINQDDFLSGNFSVDPIA